MKKKTYLLIALSIVSMGMNAQNSEKSSLGNDVPEFVKTMKIGGTIRSKYEYQTEEGEGRFEVRTARINVAGNVTKEVSYKAEIDLCDEGKIKMLDAYTRIKPWKTPAVYHRSGACAIHHRCSPFSSSAVLCQPFVHRQAGG